MRSDPELAYISGPMSGVPQFNHPAFFEAEKYLESLGWSVANPAAHDLVTYPDMKEWPGYATGDVAACPKFNLRLSLAWDLNQILRIATRVVVLPGWENKRCASIEVAVARRVNLPIHKYEDGSLSLLFGWEGE